MASVESADTSTSSFGRSSLPSQWARPSLTPDPHSFLYPSILPSSRWGLTVPARLLGRELCGLFPLEVYILGPHRFRLEVDFEPDFLKLLRISSWRNGPFIILGGWGNGGFDMRRQILTFPSEFGRQTCKFPKLRHDDDNFEWIGSGKSMMVLKIRVFALISSWRSHQNANPGSPIVGKVHIFSPPCVNYKGDECDCRCIAHLIFENLTQAGWLALESLH